MFGVLTRFDGLRNPAADASETNANTAAESTSGQNRLISGQFFIVHDGAPPGPPQRSGVRESLQQRYPELAEAVGIDALTVEKLLDLLTEHQLSTFGTDPPHASFDWLLKEADAEAKRLDTLRGLLGEEGLERYLAYSTTLRERTQVSTFDARLPSEHKLLPAQKEQMIVLYQEDDARRQRDPHNARFFERSNRFFSGAQTEDLTGLLEQAREIFKPLSKDMGTTEFPITEARAALGRMLFFDPRITIDANVACATCHQPALYGTDALPKSIGVQQRPHPRNAPTVLNAALSITHWRGDRENVEDQVIKALTSPISGGHPTEKAAADRVARIPGYVPAFKAAFPHDANPVTARNIAKAIGAYERTLVTPAPFDAYLAGNVQALSSAAEDGLQKFIETGCAACHQGVGVGGAMYTKFGLGEEYWKATGSQLIDKGRIDVTNNPGDLYVFRVPSLRNVAMTPPYFHDGSVANLPDAVTVMARVQLGMDLSDVDTRAIVTFLESLTGALPETFRASPVLPSSAVIPPK